MIERGMKKKSIIDTRGIYNITLKLGYYHAHLSLFSHLMLYTD